MGTAWTISRRCGAVLIALLAFAEAPVPPAAAQAGQRADCDAPPSAVSARSGIVTLARDKTWQPRSGDVGLNVSATGGFPLDAKIVVCFGWQHADGTISSAMPSKTVRIAELTPDRTVRLTAAVPNLPDAPSTSAGGVYTGFTTVPVAIVRVLAFDPKGEAVFDASSPIGITRTALAAAIAVGCIAVALLLIALVKPGAAQQAPMMLRPITTAGGYTSLSQLQILLWTMVVGGSAIYVMALSGELIEITTGTLVLLGISGGATLGSKLQSVREDRRAADAAAVPAPDAAPAEPRTSRWSDLVISEKEVDVTRVQMLFFTLVTAFFVALKVVTSYEIPEIPDGFVTLMGISNGVYIGSKYTTR